MGYLRKVRNDLRDAATIAREGVHEFRVDHGLGHAYGELGRRLAQLTDSGTPIPEGLEPDLARIRALEADIQTANRADTSLPQRRY